MLAFDSKFAIYFPKVHLHPHLESRGSWHIIHLAVSKFVTWFSCPLPSSKILATPLINIVLSKTLAYTNIKQNV